MTYSEMVRSLMKNPQQIQDDLSAFKANYLHAALGIATEAGEMLDTAKKVYAYGQDVDYENAVEELGDLEFYMEAMRQCLGITREQSLRSNKAKLAKRYPGYNFTNKHAAERLDKQTT